MKQHYFYRNVQARDLLETFLLAAVSSVLLVRFYLHISGYPQIGGGGLHIAHMLWGGALMLAALTVSLTFIGTRAQQITALVGGVGFGVFIDELGKFITRDNDYFYKPTIGLIYGVFVILYLIFNFVSRNQTLSSREYQLNALVQLEEAIESDLDPNEKKRIGVLLAQADPSDPLTRHIRQLLRQIDTIPQPKPGQFYHWFKRQDDFYEWFRRGRNSTKVVSVFFGVEFFFFLLSFIGTVYFNVNEIPELLAGDRPTQTGLIIGQLVCSGVAAGFILYGLWLMPRSRLRAYEQFRRALLIILLLNNFFLFARVQFGALPSFFMNLALLALTNYGIKQERDRQGKLA